MEDQIIKEKIQVVILEKESEVGGLAKSISDKRGFTWDLGVHITGGSKYLKFTHMMHKTIKDWNSVPRRVKAYMGHIINDGNPENNYVPYPVQESIPYFPKDVKNSSLNEMKELSNVKEKFNENFAEFTKSTFGSTLQEIFIRPYNEKVWTVPLEEMNSDWASSRVPHVELNKLELRCQMDREQLNQEEKTKPQSNFKLEFSL
ncbi:hypothetical protein WR25_06412 [Diploscapter pachys]|uniref:Amine oxidase domain-containing protein n=1 Tax=Diploscapter pachys TaxID=2018661 RepID=A0A2A2LZ61_9BILA|nr:hypothetical protein WR25_06412 [Diploscapter pachys]